MYVGRYGTLERLPDSILDRLLEELRDHLPAMKHEIDEEESFLSESRGSEELPTSGTGDKHRSFARAKWCYPRLLLEIGMAAAIVYLLLRAPPDQHIRKTPVPQCTPNATPPCKRYILFQT